MKKNREFPKRNYARGSNPAGTSTRSAQMRAIRSKGNRSTERRLRGALVAAGIRGWTLHAEHLPGRPDFYFDSARLAVFVDGCFWHCCPTCGHLPQMNKPYWVPKLAKNVERDNKSTRELRGRGIAVLRFFECVLRHDMHGCISQIKKQIGLRAAERRERND